MSVDFGRTADDYARHRAGFPPELFARLASAGVGLPGQTVLDLGTGTGVVARELARAGCRVTGLDPSPELLAAARRLDGEAGVEIRYVEGTAEATGLPDATFDAATAAVCWHWFDADRAARETRRVLAPGGSLAIIHFDWIATPGSVAATTEELLRRFVPPGRELARRLFLTLARRLKPEWVEGEGSGLHPDRLTTLTRAGFVALETFSFDVAIEYSHEAWRGRLRTHARLGASRPPRVVERFDRDLARLLASQHPDDPFAVPHRIFVVLGRTPKSS